MRKIKFRGISKLTNEWVYGYYYNMNTYKNDNELRHIIVYENEGPGNQNEHEPIIGRTLGEYTGLKDFEDTDIYEGDVVNIYDCQTGKFSENTHTIIYNGKSEWTIDDYWLLSRKHHKCKVVGSLYENKYL